MGYNPDADTIEPDKLGGKPQITDLNVLKRGVGGIHPRTTKMRDQDFTKEDVFLQAEEDRLNKAAKEDERLRKLEEIKKQDEDAARIQKQRELMKGGVEEKEEVVEGKLKMTDIDTMPDEVDEIIKKINEINFGVQDLDILIALSRTLKEKRLSLFPESQYAFNLQETGLSQEEMERHAAGEEGGQAD